MWRWSARRRNGSGNSTRRHRLRLKRLCSTSAGRRRFWPPDWPAKWTGSASISTRSSGAGTHFRKRPGPSAKTENVRTRSHTAITANRSPPFESCSGKYNPRLEINVSETGVNTGDNPAGGSYYVSAKSQAKFLARLYTYHLFYGIGPTCWWSLEPVKTGEYQWGLILPDGQRKEAWYALRNVAAVLDNSCRPSEELSFRGGRRNGRLRRPSPAQRFG